MLRTSTRYQSYSNFLRLLRPYRFEHRSERRSSPAPRGDLSVRRRGSYCRYRCAQAALWQGNQRSPSDERVVTRPESEGDFWSDDINIKLDERIFLINHERAIDYLNTQERLYVVDGFAGWDKEHRLRGRIICSRPYDALFMHDMLIRPYEEELEDFGDPDFVVYNSGAIPANRYTSGMTSTTSVDVCFERNEMVIIGTMYAGEMKKGIFTIMNYLMPKKGGLSMHCSANQGYEDGGATG